MADIDPHRPPVELLRPVLDAAVDVARASSTARPGGSSSKVRAARPVPAMLRPVLRFRSLPASALETVRRAIDTDAGFRSDVAGAVADDAGLNTVARLWLQRPDGWEQDVAALLVTYDEPVESLEARHARELDDALAARDRMVAERDAATRRADDASADLTAAREEVARLGAELAELAADRDRLLAERTRAVRELKATERRLAERTAEVRLLREAPAPRSSDDVGETPGPDPTDVLAALQRIAEHVDGARSGLDALAADLAIVSGSAPSGPAPATAGSRPARASASPSPRPPSRTPPAHTPTTPAATARRTPVPLPGGVVDSSPEAAQALARADGVVFVVDGYNVSQHVWPGESAAGQRQRLERALTALAARTRSRFEVVYDGVGAADRPPRSTRSLGVHTRFAPADTPADDVVVEVADQLADLLPVVVVSTDREVRDAATRRRIRTITSAQLVALL